MRRVWPVATYAPDGLKRAGCEIEWLDGPLSTVDFCFFGENFLISSCKWLCRIALFLKSRRITHLQIPHETRGNVYLSDDIKVEAILCCMLLSKFYKAPKQRLIPVAPKLVNNSPKPNFFNFTLSIKRAAFVM
jgi:hypothetical protein